MAGSIMVSTWLLLSSIYNPGRKLVCMPDASFDVVIVGTSISGLALASLCSRAGYTVLVVGHEDRPVSYTVDNITLQRQIPVVNALSTSQVLKEVFREIGLVAELRNRPTRLDPAFVALSGGTRYEWSERLETNTAEVGREFPETARDIVAFAQAATQASTPLGELLAKTPLLPETGFFARRRFNRDFIENPAWQASETPPEFPVDLAFSTPVMALLQSGLRMHGAPLPPQALHRHVAHVLGGYYEFPGGLDGLKSMLLHRLQATGGQFWAERSVEALTISGRKATEVALTVPRRQVRSKVIIGNCGLKSFFSLIPQELQLSEFHSFIKSLQPSHYHYVLNVVVRPEVIPEALARHGVICIYPHQQSLGTNVVRFYIAPRPADCPPDTPAVITTSVRLPAGELPLERRQFQQLNDRVLSSLEWVMPFLQEKLLWTHSPYVAVHPETGEERLDPSELQECYSEPVEGCLGLTAVPSRTPYKNILFLGEHYLAGLGIEGSFLAAKQAFGWIKEQVVLRKFLGK